MKLTKLIVLSILISVSTSCKKAADSTTNYSSNVLGKYGGAVPPGIIEGNIVLSRYSSTKVNIDYSNSAGNAKHFGSAIVSAVGDGKYNISLITSSDTITGVADGSYFKCYINSSYFFGVKQ